MGHGEACSPQRADYQTVEDQLQEGVPEEEAQCDKADASEVAEAQETAATPQCQAQPRVAEDDLGSVEAEVDWQSDDEAAIDLSVVPSAAGQDSPARVSVPLEGPTRAAATLESVPDSEILSPSRQPRPDGDSLVANLVVLQI